MTFLVFSLPYCGGKVRIDKNVEIDKLTTCEYCSSQIETMDLADFLRIVLS